MLRKLSDFKLGSEIEVMRKDDTYAKVKIVNVEGEEVLFESNEVFGSLIYTSNKIKLVENYWPFPTGNTEIWYTNKDNFRDLVMGYNFNLRNGTLPDPNNMKETHTLVGTMPEYNLNKIFMDMQGDNWSPEGEARESLRNKGISHTSMCVGDVIKTKDGTFMVDNAGFIDLNKEH